MIHHMGRLYVPFISVILQQKREHDTVIHIHTPFIYISIRNAINMGEEQINQTSWCMRVSEYNKAATSPDFHKQR
jgi:hypothetical protein